MGPLLGIDCPDNDVIRVDDIYYMVSTTMYFMPGCEIMKSYDLVHWEHAAYVYDCLDSTDGQRMAGRTDNIYGKGMWAASFRYHEGIFYICFICNDTHKTYLYTSEKIEGPWKKSNIEGFYHDSSLLFDDDGRVYIAYGGRDIYVTELNPDLSGPKEGGLHRLVVSDSKKAPLGYEGTHFYKINGKYYLFFIHSLEDRWFRAEACFMSDSLEGEFKGGDVFVDDCTRPGAGIAQGAIVDTPEGNWYAILFQDRGAIGRIPFIIPVTWENDLPIIGDQGKMPDNFKTPAPKYGYEYKPFVHDDPFTNEFGEGSCFGFDSMWQFNHEPDMELIVRKPQTGIYGVITDKLCDSPVQAKNSLTVRMHETKCSAEVTLYGGMLKEGDYAGMMALQYMYGFIGITPYLDSYEIVYMERDEASKENTVTGVTIIPVPIVRVKIEADFTNQKDEAEFFYDAGNGWQKAPFKLHMSFRLEHFTGYRFALTAFSTKETGGIASFGNFKYFFEK